MIYSYTQLSQYLACPRRYRHRYLDGWKEKDTRAAMLFGRAFEQAPAGLLPAARMPRLALFREWSAHQAGALGVPRGARPGTACFYQRIHLLAPFLELSED